jgi:hypothetical protein
MKNLMDFSSDEIFKMILDIRIPEDIAKRFKGNLLGFVVVNHG